MSDMMHERRGAPRYHVAVDAQAMDLRTRSTFKLRCSDISLSGCYLDTLNPMEAGTPLWVRLEHRHRAFECQAKVAYAVPNMGMGVAFSDPIPEDHLANFTG